MFQNYFKTALRNLWRFKGFSFINIASLSIGLAGCLIIGLFVNDELQFDTFIKGGENVYRIYDKRTDNQGTTSLAVVPPTFAPFLKQQYPEVDSSLRILMASGKMLVEANNIQAYEEKWLLTESTFFNLFPLELISGDPQTALADPFSIVITQGFSNKYFGKQEAIGQTIKIDKIDYRISGVLQKVPEHFHLQFDFLMPLASAGIPKERMEAWQWQQFYTYIKVKPGTDLTKLQSKFQQAIIKDIHPKMKVYEYVWTDAISAGAFATRQPSTAITLQ